MNQIRWTDEQARALLARGHVLLSANAGTGKTRTIVGRIAWQIGLEVESRSDGRPIEPCSAPCRLDEVAAITFTEKAACELKHRLRARIMKSARAPQLRWELDRMSVGTIHAFCAGLLRDHALRLGIDPAFRVLDEREAALRLRDVVRDSVMRAVHDGAPGIATLLERLGLRAGRQGPGLIDTVSAVVGEVRWRSDGPDEVGAREASVDATDAEPLALAASLHALGRQAADAWLDRMNRENVRDFDSLVLDARRLLTDPENRAALVSIRRALRVLVIDEFQDTDAAQRDIAFALAGIDESDPGPVPELMLVGDPRQSIYGFRGADVAVWNDARNRLCGATPPLELTKNFRTRPGVIGFINRVASTAFETTGEEVEEFDPGLRVGYSPLEAVRPAGPGQGVDWLDCSVEGGSIGAVRAFEARLVRARVAGLLADGRLADPEAADGRRPVRASDIAILARTRRGLERVDGALRRAGIPAHNAAGLGLSNRPEVLDLLTVLRLLVDPADDYHALAFLRSPFVGLRDEVIAGFRLGPSGRRAPLLRQAARHLARVERGEAEWFEAPEHASIGAIEQDALGRGLAGLAAGQALVDRAPASELLADVLRRTGYRLHLSLRPGTDEALGSIERFVALLDEHRRLPLPRFLDMWDRWGDTDPGLPRGPVHGAADAAVTLQTIHTAKGLEWPIVFLLQAGDGFRDRLTDRCVEDPRLGPVLMPKQSERGPRSRAIAARALAAERAEEARLLYVALTRARDRVVIAAPDEARGYMEYIRPALAEATLPHLVSDGPPPERKRASRARADDPVTRTGRQIEVFADDATGQLDIFRNAPVSTRSSGEPAALRPVVYRAAEPEQRTIDRVPVSLAWLDGLRPAEPPALARPLARPALRTTTSATELQLRATDRRAWRLRYAHGVEEAWRFAPRAGDGPSIPAALRGTLIHGVLERIEAADELSRLLGEAIAGVDEPPGAEELLEPGAPYRVALEAEIERVVTGERWRWYVAGPHHRELAFLVLAGGPPWVTGAIDLYRPGKNPCIVDFKTHRIPAERAEAVAAAYAVQARVYRDAVSLLAGTGPRVLFHFTHPGTVVEA
ncbi:MAG: UvrD-helicase domain-containing protein [Gemmatimonadota bacterium]